MRSGMAGMMLLVFALSGCGGSGPKLSPISGKVTYQGKPVAAGRIRFSNPKIGIDIMADLQSGGSYTVTTARGPGLPEGTYQVAIVPPRVDVPIETMTPPPQPNCPDIPAKYRQPSSSGLTLTVKPGGNGFDVDMQP